MGKNKEKSVKTDKKLKSHLFQAGNDPRRNLNGRPKGVENFTTKWRKAVEKIAQMNNISEDEVEMQLLLTGYKKAKEGEYSFYKDIHDRIYGKAPQTIELSADLKTEDSLSKEQKQNLLSLLDDKTSS